MLLHDPNHSQLQGPDSVTLIPTHPPIDAGRGKEERILVWSGSYDFEVWQLSVSGQSALCWDTLLGALLVDPSVCVCVCSIDSYDPTILLSSLMSLPQLGYDIPGKQTLPRRCLTQADDDQSSGLTPTVEEQALATAHSYADEDGAANIQSLTEHNLYLEQALALAEQISSELAELREAVEKVAATH